MSQEMLDRILNTVIDINVNMDRRFEKVFDHFDRLVDRMGETAVLEMSLIVKGHEEQIGQMGRGE